MAEHGTAFWRGAARQAYRYPDGTVWVYGNKGGHYGYHRAGHIVARTFKAHDRG